MRTVTTDELPLFFQAIEDKIDHHGEAWREVVYALAFNVMAKLDSAQPIKVGERDGRFFSKVALTLKNGYPLTIWYRTRFGDIQLINRGTGEVRYTFERDHSAEEVASIIKKMSNWRKKREGEVRVRQTELCP